MPRHRFDTAATAAIIAAASMLAACNSEPANEPAAAAGTPLTVQVGEVLSAAGSGAGPNATERRLYGKFEIRAPQAGEPSILSNNGPGGACLVAQVPVQPKVCSLDSECDYSPNPGQPAKWHGYCLGADSATARPGTCWVNAIESCLRGQPPGAYQTPVVNASDVYAKLGQVPVKWRLIGCLSGTYSGGPPPCASGDPTRVLVDLGVIRQVP